MKTNKLNIFVIVFAILIAFTRCGDDEVVVTTIPDFSSFEENISSLPGQILTLEGTVSDPAGIKSVNINYDAWFLDKTIVKDDLPESYDISYNFKVPEDAVENSTHTINILVTNSGGKTTERSATITLDKDIEAPVIQISSPVDGGTVVIGSGNEVDINITVTDKELAEFKIESDILNETVAVSGTSYTYTKSLDIANSGSYTFKVTSTDLSGNVSTKSSKVNVLNSLSFDVMYATEVTDPALLTSDLFGVPFVTEASTASSEDGFVFTAKYYSPAPNSEIRFLAQKGSFGPYAYGGDANTPGKLVLGSDETVSPIVLPAQGYYEVKIDLRDSSYTLTPYTPTDSAFPQVYIIGTGVYISDTVSTCTNNNTGALTCWNFASGKPFTKDPNNDYLWTIDVTLKDEPANNGSNGFILNANPAGWSPFWRLDDGVEPTATVPNGGTNFVFPDSALDKDYTFTFDTHLNRISATIR